MSSRQRQSSSSRASHASPCFFDIEFSCKVAWFQAQIFKQPARELCRVTALVPCTAVLSVVVWEALELLFSIDRGYRKDLFKLYEKKSPRSVSISWPDKCLLGYLPLILHIHASCRLCLLSHGKQLGVDLDVILFWKMAICNFLYIINILELHCSYYDLLPLLKIENSVNIRTLLKTVPYEI